MALLKCLYGTLYNNLLCLFTNSRIVSFLCADALSKIIILFLYFSVINFCKNSTNRSVFIPPFSYKSLNIIYMKLT